MEKEYIVRLTDSEREMLIRLGKTRRISTQQVRRELGGGVGPRRSPPTIGGISRFSCSRKRVSRSGAPKGIPV
jgi:hypothetical protein